MVQISLIYHKGCSILSTAITKKQKQMKTFKIVCKETGSVIETFHSFDEALDALSEYEYQDSKDGVFTENFYEII